MDTYTFFKDFAGPGSAVIASGVAAWITWRFQYQQVAIAKQQAATAQAAAETARNKLRYDIWDKRFAKYRVVDQHMSSVALWKPGEQLNVLAYLLEVYDARWLFGPEVEQWLQEDLNKAYVQLYIVMIELTNRQDLTDGEKQQVFFAAYIDHLQPMYAQRDEVFKPYLSMPFR